MENNYVPNQLLRMQYNNNPDAQKRHGNNVVIHISTPSLAGKRAHQYQFPFQAYASQVQNACSDHHTNVW
jgi:hypothetical protein